MYEQRKYYSHPISYMMYLCRKCTIKGTNGMRDRQPDLLLGLYRLISSSMLSMFMLGGGGGGGRSD